MDGAGGSVLAIKFGVLTPQAFLALINVIFCTSMGSFPCWMFFTIAHVLSFAFIQRINIGLFSNMSNYLIFLLVYKGRLILYTF
jgi:hypothetical protein